MAFSLKETPEFQELSPEVAAKLSPQEIENFYRLAAVSHLLIDLARCLALDLEEPENQTSDALSEVEFSLLALSILSGLSRTVEVLRAPDFQKYLEVCRAKQSPTVN